MCGDANDTEKADITKYKIQCGVSYSYPDAVLEKIITDSDNDGMADDWELARGLDPNVNDAAGDYCGQGYMNIEYYINDLTVDSFPSGVVVLSPEKKKITGDVNADGKCSIADAGMLQKWLLGTVDLTDPTAGELNDDGNLNAAYFALLKRILLMQCVVSLHI